MMEPITATLTSAKELCETAKTVQKVYNVSKEMKTVAESEGKDQIMATKNLAGTASRMQHEGNVGKGEKGESSSEKLKIEGDFIYEDNNENLINGAFVHKLEPYHIAEMSITEPVEFVERFSSDETVQNKDVKDNIFVDRLSSFENGISGEYNSTLLQNESSKDVVEQASINSYDVTDSSQEKMPEGLTEQEKQAVKEKTGWSDKIVDAIRTKDEAQVYIDAGLVEGEVNGKPALLQPDIDGKAYNAPQWPDWNNKDLAEESYPPRDKNGRPYELHHIGQNPDSPLAELTYEQHHSDGNFKVLHTFDESSIDRVQFNKERKEYWSERSKSL